MAGHEDCRTDTQPRPEVGRGLQDETDRPFALES